MFGFTWIQIIAILLVVDSLGAMWIAWFGKRWFLQYFSIFARYFPPAKGWTTWYFVLTLIILFMALGKI